MHAYATHDVPRVVDSTKTQLAQYKFKYTYIINDVLKAIDPIEVQWDNLQPQMHAYIGHT